MPRDDKPLAHRPLIDAKVYPDHVDISLVKGVVSSEEDLRKITLFHQCLVDLLEGRTPDTRGARFGR